MAGTLDRGVAEPLGWLTRMSFSRSRLTCGGRKAKPALGPVLLGALAGWLLVACASPTVEPTAAPTLAQTPKASRLPLVVLHTNDNWGEVEPCG